MLFNAYLCRNCDQKSFPSFLHLLHHADQRIHLFTPVALTLHIADQRTHLFASIALALDHADHRAHEADKNAAGEESLNETFKDRLGGEN